MARRYDSRTTIFSPEGRLFQVEYAMEAISNAGAAIGLRAQDGVVLVAEKKITSKLLDTHAVGVRREKMYRLDDHLCCAVAGITGAVAVVGGGVRCGGCGCATGVVHVTCRVCVCVGGGAVGEVCVLRAHSRVPPQRDVSVAAAATPHTAHTSRGRPRAHA
jgi:hypothetical protein